MAVLKSPTFDMYDLPSVPVQSIFQASEVQSMFSLL